MRPDWWQAALVAVIGIALLYALIWGSRQMREDDEAHADAVDQQWSTAPHHEAEDLEER